jgi:2-iminoacetate synthase
MSFLETFNTIPFESLLSHSQVVDATTVARVLQKNHFTLLDLPVLLSPAAANFLEPLAQKAQAITTQRFGKTMSLFAPLYLSNACYNKCTYCGFSMELDYPRKVLSDAEILDEVAVLSKRGIKHVLILTGEAPDVAGVDYLEHCIRLIAPHFSSVGIEVQPLKQIEYERFIRAGVSSLTVYQETYDREAYAVHHVAGKKRNFDLRLDTATRGAKAGMFRINLGALLGLSDWRYEAIALAHHLHYMRKHYWQVKLGLSFPRIQKMVGQYSPPHDIDDASLVQYICTMRLLFPDAHISLSTREKELLRNSLLHIAITEMSADSCTDPGGYTDLGAVEQFEISDERSVAEIQALLVQNGFDPVLKDWDSSLSPS